MLLLWKSLTFHDFIHELKEQLSFYNCVLYNNEMLKISRGLQAVRCRQRRLHHEGRNVQHSRRDLSDGGMYLNIIIYRSYSLIAIFFTKQKKRITVQASILKFMKIYI